MSCLEFAVDAFTHLTLMQPSFTAFGGSLFTWTCLLSPINCNSPEVRIGLYLYVSPMAPSSAPLCNEGAYSSIKDKYQFVKVDLFVKDMMLASFYLEMLWTLHYEH